MLAARSLRFSFRFNGKAVTLNAHGLERVIFKAVSVSFRHTYP